MCSRSRAIFTGFSAVYRHHQPFKQLLQTPLSFRGSLSGEPRIMSHRGGGHGFKRSRGGGPNRGGGRGRGRGGPPPGLKGREIGMFYAKKSQEKKKEREKNERAVVSISREAERDIGRILEDVRRSSSAGDSSQTSQTSYADSGVAVSAKSNSMVGVDSVDSGMGVGGVMDVQGVTSFETHIPTPMDEQLKQELLEKRRTNSKYQKMMEFRETLPSWKVKEEVLRLVRENQVCVISGETGCGKTTQVPQFILDDAILSGCGSRCQVICTQPRRISAISVAQRVAGERGESLGRGVGFQIRLENTLPRDQASILYCTQGILHRKLIGDSLLSGVSHVIMDEVHERNVASDFLTIIMRDLLPKRPDLKLILMSATINAELFSKYFNDAPMFTIPNVTYPVTEYFLEETLNMTRYAPPPGSQRTQKPRHYRSRFGEGKQEYLKQLAEDEERKEYIKSLEGTFPSRVLDALLNFEEKDIDLNLILAVLRHICTAMGDGAILIFLPGWDTISKLYDMLQANPVFRSSKYIVIPLHSMMPTAFQQQVFDRPPPGVRKIVIATNIAETSITIDDVVYVIDCGKVKETTYDATHQLECLEAVWVSQAAARQRRGRAGRVQAGVCFHLYTKHHHSKMAEYQVPEMLRTPLEELVLQIKILGLGMAFPFLSKAIEPPSDRAVNNAINCLKDLNALTGDEQLTPLGHHLANLPVNPRIGKIILFAAMFSCLDPVLTITSALGFKEPFVIPLHKQEEADAVKKRFARSSRSDHIALLHAFQGWERARSSGNTRQYCWDNFLASNTLELFPDIVTRSYGVKIATLEWKSIGLKVISRSLHPEELLHDMKGQFASLLFNTGFIGCSDPKDPASNVNSSNMKLVKAVLCSGLYPNVIKIDQNKPGSYPKLYTKKDGRVKFHPKSVNCEETFFTNKFMIYHQKIKSSAVFIHDSTMIPPLPLLFFGGEISVQRDETQETIAVDEWIVFQAPEKIAKLVKEMREQLDTVLQQKIAMPSMELYEPHKPHPSPTSQLIQAIIDLITSEDYTHQAQRLAAGKHLYYGRR